LNPRRPETEKTVIRNGMQSTTTHSERVTVGGACDGGGEDKGGIDVGCTGNNPGGDAFEVLKDSAQPGWPRRCRLGRRRFPGKNLSPVPQGCLYGIFGRPRFRSRSIFRSCQRRIGLV
jgi:hypothetical protein